MSNGEDVQRINELLAERFNRIEAAVASAKSIAGLFEALLSGVENEFGVPFVWLTLLDDEDNDAILSALQISDMLKTRYSIISPELMGELLPGGMKPVLANEDVKPFYRLLPPSRKYFVRSIAVVPFALSGRRLGTWNNGDADANRYAPDMKTDLLESVARRISDKLTALVNGEFPQQCPGGLHG